MLVGINYPWIDYGWDFGDPPPEWISAEILPGWRAKKRRQIMEDFKLFASQGIFAVRWFLLADGLNYGMGKSAPRESDGRWTFELLPEGHPYYSRLQDDFRFVLQACRANGLKLFPSLMDFHWCLQGVRVGTPGIIKGGRYDIVRDAEKRKLFLDRVLEPILDLSAQFLDSIYAWELINEPEWVVRHFSVSGKKDANQNVSRDEMEDFIAEGMRRINSRQLMDGSSVFQSSVGFAHWETLDKWDAAELGITLPQFHYYAQQNCNLPEHSHLRFQPCVVGEFATASSGEWPDLKYANKSQTTANRLACLLSKGYAACFLWSARAVDPATRWTDVEHRDVIAYTTSIMPDSRQI